MVGFSHFLYLVKETLLLNLVLLSFMDILAVWFFFFDSLYLLFLAFLVIYPTKEGKKSTLFLYKFFTFVNFIYKKSS